MTIILYLITLILLFISFIKDKNKTKKALKKGLKAFENILPQFLGVIVLAGILLAIFSPELISKIIGDKSGIFGILISAIIGSITLIPGFIAFPTAALLLENGAGYMQIASFISTLMMVGIITFSIEKTYFNTKFTIARNLLAFIFSFIVAFIIGKVVI
ncbi:hypothetical protein EV215_0299 [Hypnocyclicus thermotrophus]|uniref:Permease n=1 Tax=Hypnocyclicus thermotrophus TaxID=1627895 RepID=A0AA46E1B4_9FUSO|nr:permease [Hypnocyclicus thermotrophus]TDT72493.1 hypothetical protein EV215_0299 [Hypnocyclicus thermotrophus]